MPALTRDTLRTTSWDTIYTFLQTTDPITTNNIFSAYNSKLVRDTGYPLVIIEPPTVSFDSVAFGTDFTAHNITMNISIYHNSSQNLKAVADEVTSKLHAGKSVFRGFGLANQNITEGDYDTWQEGNKKIHRYSFDVSFMWLKDG